MRSVEQKIEELNESHYSLTTETLPTLGARTSNRRVGLRNYIISPHTRRYRIWETFLAVLVIYTAWASPFEFGFLTKPEGVFPIIDNVVNGFFFVDIILTFFVAYLDRATYELIDEHKKIASRYVKSWFAFDVIATVPSELVYMITPPHIHSYGLFNMLRLWRLRRVGILFSRLEKDTNYNYFWVRGAKLICLNLFWAHCSACFFYYFAADNPHPNRTWLGVSGEIFLDYSIWIRYLKSIYWSVETLTTVGYGDLHPVSKTEMIYGIFDMIINACLFSYLIGNITHMVVHSSTKTLQYRDGMRAALSFTRRNHLPVKLQDQILAHLSLKFRTELEGLQQQETTIQSLPRAIQSNISHYLFHSLVDQVYLFRSVSNNLLFQLVSEMKAEYFPPKEDVILQDEAPTDFYILVSGTAELVVTRNGVEQIVGELKSGDLCGEIGVLCSKPQLFTVQTKRLSQLLRLNRTAFLNAVQANARDGTIIMNNLLQHLKDLNDPMMEGVLKETEKMLARGCMDLPLSLCFAAARGDDLLLNQMLKRGLDPNESDNNGRTALHITASKGNEHCVRLLLDHGAEPNCRDSDGNVPLWEAILGGHDHLSKLLHENGAVLDAGDVGHFACTAAEQNSMKLLEEIVRYGGDITAVRSTGETALHIAVSEANIEIVKYLVKQGADIDKPDFSGWTPRALADQQGHEEITIFFQSKVEDQPKLHTTVSIVPDRPVPMLGRFASESTVFPARNQEGWSQGIGGSLGRTRPRRRTNCLYNSLFGVMSEQDTPFSIDMARVPREHGKIDNNSNKSSIRVTISCSLESDSVRKLVILPRRFEDLLDLGLKKFGVLAKRVVNREGVEIEEIEVIRDGDYLVLLGD